MAWPMVNAAPQLQCVLSYPRLTAVRKYIYPGPVAIGSHGGWSSSDCESGRDQYFDQFVSC